MSDSVQNLDNASYPSRSYDRVAHQRYIALLLDRLSDLERETAPVKDDNIKNKDQRAFDALQMAGELVQAVAGWALDHAAGLGTESLQFVPRQPSGTRDHVEYLAAKAEVDQHRHERAGATLRDQPCEADPIISRQILINLLVGNSGGLPIGIAEETVRSLTALNFGEVLPLLAPTHTNSKVRYQGLNMQLSALEFVEYLQVKGQKKSSAQELVADAFGVSPDTLRTWGKGFERTWGL